MNETGRHSQTLFHLLFQILNECSFPPFTDFFLVVTWKKKLSYSNNVEARTAQYSFIPVAYRLFCLVLLRVLFYSFSLAVSQHVVFLFLSFFLSFSVCVGFFVNVPGAAWFLLLFFAHQPSTIWLSHHFSNDDNEHGGRETRQTHTQSPSPLYYNYYYVSLLIVLLFVVCERGKLREKLRERVQ